MEHNNPWNCERLLRGYTINDQTHMATKEISLEDPAQFDMFTKMTKQNFYKLLNFVGPHIESLSMGVAEDTVTIHTSVLITLRFLTTANSIKNLSMEFGVSADIISNLIPKTLKCIFEGLRKDYYAACNTSEQWKQIAKNFETKWSFPQCMGALGAKHLAIKPTPEDEFLFLNCMGFHSILLFAAIDADYKFTIIEVGTEGTANAEDVLGTTTIGDALEFNKNLNFPEDSSLPGTKKKVPYVFLSTEAFEIGPRLLVPYKHNVADENMEFNRRLAAVCTVVQKAFDILTNVFPILHKTNQFNVEQVQAITLAVCALHNFLLSENREKYLVISLGAKELLGIDKCPDECCEDHDGVETRNSFCDYFNGFF